jgi:hypothetical protein
VVFPFHIHRGRGSNMQFYPHKISVNTTAAAVSASIALTGSFINNFSAIQINRVLTASIALNITGSRGTDGTSVDIIGPTGPVGARGETGFRGGNIFLLSSSWSGSACGGGATCGGPYSLIPAGPGVGECGVARGSSYRINSSINLSSVSDDSADRLILFTNEGTCAVVAANVGVHNGSRVFYTDGAGVISSIPCVTAPPPPPAPVCNGPYLLYNTGPSEGNCGQSEGSANYYTNYNGDPILDLLSGANRTQADGFILYTDTCTTVAASVSVSTAGGAILATNGSGVITSSDCTA